MARGSGRGLVHMEKSKMTKVSVCMDVELSERDILRAVILEDQAGQWGLYITPSNAEICLTEQDLSKVLDEIRKRQRSESDPKKILEKLEDNEARLGALESKSQDQSPSAMWRLPQ